MSSTELNGAETLAPLPPHAYTEDRLYREFDLTHHCDSHNHSRHFSLDASQSVDEMVAFVRSMGFRRYGISDHYDPGHLDISEGEILLQRDRERYPKLEDQPIQKSEWLFSIPDYFDYLKPKQAELLEGPDPFELQIGIELGYLPELKDDLNEMVARWPFDHVLGSAHSVDNCEIYANQALYDLGKETAYSRYLERLIEISRELDIDILAHYDYVTRYNDYRQPKFFYREFPDLFDELFRTMIERGISLEINTGTQVRALGTPAPSRSYPLTEVDLPDKNILLRYKELGGELISIASDAHHVGHGARLFKENLAYLESLGFRYAFHFKERKPVAVPLRG